MKKYFLIASLLTISLNLNAEKIDSTVVLKNTSVTESEVLDAQQAWGKALVQISQDFKKSGLKKAQKTAINVIDSAYGYNDGPVLFKPTLAHGNQTFRLAKEGALAYFVGNNKNFPSDSGFALKGWSKYSIENKGIFINGNMAVTQGNVVLTNDKGETTVVDKTWGFKKDDQGKLKIILHHSSLPYQPK